MRASRLTAPRHAVGASCAALAILAAGCGGAAGPGETKTSAGGVQAAGTQLERYRAVPHFTAPGPSFDAAASVRGKQIYEIPITSTVPFVSAVEQGMRQAAGVVGAKLTVYPNAGTPSEWAQGISTAIAHHAAAVLLLAQDPRLLTPQIAEARRAGIPVIVLRTTGEGEPCQAASANAPSDKRCVPGPFEQAGRLEADAAITQSGGHADVLVITSNDAHSTAPLVRGLSGELRERCDGCRMRSVDVPIPDWATRIPTEVQSALVRDPQIDYVIPIYDSMSQFAIPAIRAAGAGGRVKISTFNGTPFVLKLLQEHEVLASDVGESLAWVGWASMDQAFRAIAGQPPVRSEHTPLRVFDATNVAQAGNPPRFDSGYGGAYVEGYRKLWGAPQ